MPHFVSLAVFVVVTFTSLLGNVAATPTSESLAEGDGGHGTIFRLDTESYEKTLQDYPFGIIMFSVSWCRHCKEQRPIMKAVAAQEHVIKMGVRFSEVDCEDQADLCDLLGLKSWPTIVYHIHGQIYTYRGDRSAQRLFEFAYLIAAGAGMHYMDLVGTFSLYCKHEPLKNRFIFVHKQNNTMSASYKIMVEAVKRSIHYDGLQFAQLADKETFEKFAKKGDTDIILVACATGDSVMRKFPEPLLNETSVINWIQQNRFLKVEGLSQYIFTNHIQPGQWLCMIISYFNTTLRGFRLARAIAERANVSKCVWLHTDPTIWTPFLETHGIMQPTIADHTHRFVIHDADRSLTWHKEALDFGINRVLQEGGDEKKAANEVLDVISGMEEAQFFPRDSWVRARINAFSFTNPEHVLPSAVAVFLAVRFIFTLVNDVIPNLRAALKITEKKE